MSIERQKGEITLICDDCGDDLGKSFDKDDFRGMIDHAKAEGWSVKKDTLDDSEWVHLCPDCRG